MKGRLRLAVVDPEKRLPTDNHPELTTRRFAACDGPFWSCPADARAVSLDGLRDFVFASVAGTDPNRVPYLVFGPASGLALAFSCGCADYLREPVSEDELLIRVEKAVDRWTMADRWIVELAARTALSAREESVLRMLIAARGETVARRAIAHGFGPSAGRRAVDACISTLRRKLGQAGSEGVYIATARGEGYGLVGFWTGAPSCVQAVDNCRSNGTSKNSFRS